MKADDLFDWGDGKVALKASRTRYRLEFYDNGPNCKHPVTQYGLVLDVDNSAERYNINFGVQTLQDLADAHSSPYTFSAGQATIMGMLNRAIALPAYTDLATSKKNALAGTGQHNLGYGKGAHHHGIGAVLVTNGTNAPNVYLFMDGNETALINEWEAVSHSSHAGKKWQIRF